MASKRLRQLIGWRSVKRHACGEWDYLVIEKSDPEFAACTCDFSHAYDRVSTGRAGSPDSRRG